MFLLAAGLGSRLKPLTDRTPKCLLPIQGKPMLEIWLSHLARCGVDEVLVNTHHLHEQVVAFASSWSSKKPKLVLSYEPLLLGSAGTLYANQDFIKGEEHFLVCYADNLTHFNVMLLNQILMERHQENPLGIMALHRSEEPQRCGIAVMDHVGWIREFEEKPKQPKSHLANAGLYAFTKEALRFLPDKIPSDIAFHFIPKLLPRLLGLEIKDPLIDIGMINAYHQVNDPSFWKSET